MTAMKLRKTVKSVEYNDTCVGVYSGIPEIELEVSTRMMASCEQKKKKKKVWTPLN